MKCQKGMCMTCVWHNKGSVCVFESVSVCVSLCVYVSLSCCLWVCICLSVCVWHKGHKGHDPFHMFLVLHVSFKKQDYIYISKQWYGSLYHDSDSDIIYKPLYNPCLLSQGWQSHERVFYREIPVGVNLFPEFPPHFYSPVPTRIDQTFRIF